MSAAGSSMRGRCKGMRNEDYAREGDDDSDVVH